MTQFYTKDMIKMNTWKCLSVKVFWGFIRIHYHFGPTEKYPKPNFRLRSIHIGRWRVPLKYYEI